MIVAAVFEIKVLLMVYIRAFQIDEVAPIDTRFSATIQPRRVGHEDEGANMPLRLKVLA